jgi:hypothetical protein
VQSLHLSRRGRATCHQPTTLTGDALSQHLMRLVQSAGRRCQSHPANDAPDRSVGKQCARAKRRTIPITPSTRNFPCTPRIRRSRASGHKNITPAANIVCSKRYIIYVLGPTCQGPAPLCMPPFNYKRGGMRRYTGGGGGAPPNKIDSLRHSQVHTSSQAIHHTVE